MSDREIVTLGIGSFGVLAATQWANGLSQYEVENSNCVFHEVNSRRQEQQKAVRAVFLDQSYQSSIKDEVGQVENVDQQLHSTLDVNPSLDVMNIFGKNTTRKMKSSNHKQQKGGKKVGIQKSHQDDSDEDEDEDEYLSYGKWPTKSASNIWARGNILGDDEEEEEEEEYGDDHNDDENQDHDDDDRDQEPSSELISKKFREQTYKPPRGDFHHPWWQYLTAPHRRDLDRVVSFMDLPNTTDSGGWSQLRSFGYGYYDSNVHAYLANSERLGFLDNLRRELECCDRLQGVQLFVDADSVFGGIASYVSSHVLADDFGFKKTMAVSCFPDAGQKDPLVKRAEKLAHLAENEQLPAGAMLPEAVELLLEDNRNLNRGLATSILSASTACYIPHEILSWDQMMKTSSSPHGRQLPGLRTDDDIAAASIVATYQDSILMPCRGVTSTEAREVQTAPNSSSTFVRQADTIGIAGAQLEACSSNFTAGQFMEMLRPGSDMRIQSAYLALPFMHMDPASTMFKTKEQLEKFQQHQSSSSSSSNNHNQDPRMRFHGGGSASSSSSSQNQHGKTQDNSTKSMLFDILNNSAPLANMQRGAFRPLSGVVVDPSLVMTESHQVIAHSYTIRAGIPWIGDGEDHRQSMREALIQYTMDLRCPNFVGYAVREPLPLSATFPKRIFAPPVKENDNEHDKSEKLKSTIEKLKKIKTVSSGAHALTTHSAGAYLKQVHQGALRKNMHLRGDTRARNLMSVDVDSWRELEEDLAHLTDQYSFEGPDDKHEVDDEGY